MRLRELSCGVTVAWGALVGWDWIWIGVSKGSVSCIGSLSLKAAPAASKGRKRSNWEIVCTDFILLGNSESPLWLCWPEKRLSKLLIRRNTPHQTPARNRMEKGEMRRVKFKTTNGRESGQDIYTHFEQHNARRLHREMETRPSCSSKEHSVWSTVNLGLRRLIRKNLPNLVITLAKTR